MKIKEEWTYEEFIDLLGEAETNASSGWEMDFVEDMRERFAKWGTDMLLSDKQVEQLKRIAGA